jgi:hypothetical protein
VRSRCRGCTDVDRSGAFGCRLPDSALGQYNYYLDTQRLRIAVSNMKNSNTPEELEKIKQQVRTALGRGRQHFGQ